MNMIEKVARAIWDCAEDEYSFDDAKKGNHSAYQFTMLEAKLAIEAMKEPTPEMLNAAHECTVAGCCLVGQERALDVWEEMIQTALDGK